MARGRFDVQVVTNADEVEGGFKVFCGEQSQADRSFPFSDGLVKVYTTTLLKRGSYIPWSNPYASKLLGVALQAVSAQNSDLIVGWYFEPYGVVATIVGMILNKPVILRHAGSDLGRLSLHPDLRQTYAWMLKNATHILTSRGLEERLCELGASKTQISFISAPRLPWLFSNPKSRLDVNFYAAAFAKWAAEAGIPGELSTAVQQNNRKAFATGNPVICCFGKVGETKGSFSMLNALEQVARSGNAFSFVSVPCGHVSNLVKFYEQCLRAENLAKRSWILPALPPWEIPNLLAISNVGLFLENKFSISFHSPKIPREILASGACLVCSSEIVRKHPYKESFVDMKNTVIIEDPDDVETLAAKIQNLLAKPVDTAMIGKHGQYLSKFIESELPEKSPMHNFLERYLPA